MIFRPGKRSFVFSVVCDRNVFRNVIPQMLSDALIQQLSLIHIHPEAGPSRVVNPMVLGFRLLAHVTEVYEIITQVWFNNTADVNLDDILVSFINAWNISVGRNGRECLFPGTADEFLNREISPGSAYRNFDYSVALNVIKSGSMVVCASSYSNTIGVSAALGLIGPIAPINPIYQVTYETESFTNAVPVWGVNNVVDRATMSDVIISNQQSFIGTQVNALNVTNLSRDAVHAATETARDIANGAGEEIKSFVSENLPNILPITNNEFQTIKTVGLVGLFLVVGYFGIAAVSKGVGP